MDHQNNEKLVTERDGSELAGVSLETLRQYRSIGILQGTERNGEIFYSRDELASVFFVRPQFGTAVPPTALSQSPGPSSESASGISSDGQAPQNGFSTSSISIDPVSIGEPAPHSTDFVIEKPGIEPPKAAPADEPHTAQPQVNPEKTGTFTEPAEFFPLQSVQSSRLPAQIDHDSLQLTRTLREQVEMLKEERDWLRVRLEKLELRYEREQMILLSENDTVRTLIHQIGKPKRRWWHALPWFSAEDSKR